MDPLPVLPTSLSPFLPLFLLHSISPSFSPLPRSLFLSPSFSLGPPLSRMCVHVYVHVCVWVLVCMCVWVLVCLLCTHQLSIKHKDLQ